MKALVLAVLLTGCYFKTKDTLVETPFTAAETSTTVVAAHDPQVTADSRANVLTFRVATPRQCVTQTTQVFEIKQDKKVAIGVSAWLIPAVLVPWSLLIVVPVSGLIAVARVNNHDAETYTERRVLASRTVACSAPVAGEIATVRFPSGATFVATTDDRGMASVTIPDDEIDHGAARIELETVGRTVDYDRRSYDHEQLAVMVDDE